MEQIYLTRRNLLTLLNKLDRVKSGGQSTCTLLKNDQAHSKYPQTMRSCAVTALEDEEYYTDRKPGPVKPEDEPK